MRSASCRAGDALFAVTLSLGHASALSWLLLSALTRLSGLAHAAARAPAGAGHAALSGLAHSAAAAATAWHALAAALSALTGLTGALLRVVASQIDETSVCSPAREILRPAAQRGNSPAG